ncbi:recombinase family protein [Sphaerisporangium sp. NBC_01403]|uniref:hypothetical protein n=1 Tax=Sphaerisporangium sp. NBC_01403 TaxID=2903599 RepID=UPI00324EAD00
MFAEFEVDLLRMRTREGMAVAKAKGKLRGKQPKLSARQQAELRRMRDATRDGAEYTTALRAEQAGLTVTTGDELGEPFCDEDVIKNGLSGLEGPDTAPGARWITWSTP